MSDNKKDDKHTSFLKDKLKNNQSNGSFIFPSSYPDANSNFNFNPDGDTNVRYVPIDQLKDAPSEWNFYKPLNDDKMAELVESIVNNGLLNPIIVWETNDDPTNPEYMILSGHNRKKAFEFLREITNDKKFDKIAALIKKKNEITEDDAKEIIIDTNWVQRTLSNVEKAFSIIHKYGILQKKYADNNKDGRIRDKLAEEYNISGRHIDNYRKLNNLFKGIMDMVLKGEVSITAAYEVAGLRMSMQEWIYNNHKDKIKSKYLRKIKSDMTDDEIKEIFLEVNNYEDMTLKLTVPLDISNFYKNLDDKNKKAIRKRLQESIISVIKDYASSM